MEINAKQVKELREKTGAGMMDCKNALVDAKGMTRVASLQSCPAFESQTRDTLVLQQFEVDGANDVEVAHPQVVVEVEWQANSERNVLGYRVFKPLASEPFKALVCPPSSSELSQGTSCTDFNPPAPTEKNLTGLADGSLYRLRAG